MANKKTNLIEIEVKNHKLVFGTLPDLFSPKNIDVGSKLLIDEIIKSDIVYKNALDWGCGWGYMAIFLAFSNPKSFVTAIDSDIAAVKISQDNKTLNHLKNLEIIPSYGYDGLGKNITYDLIVSHPPTHRGRQIVEDMISESYNHLDKGGSLYLVVEARLKSWVARSLKQNFAEYKLVKRTSKHVVLRAKK
ncbi:MAG: methyltransferase [bacterium]